MKPRSDVALLCVTHDSRQLLGAFADATRAAIADVDARIVVIDSGSRDDTVAVARDQLPDADVISLDGNRGYAAGINAGVAQVRASGGAEVYVVLNPDVLLTPGAVTRLVRALLSQGAGLAVPQLRDEHGALQQSLRRAPSAVATWLEAFLGGPLAGRLRFPTEVVWDVSAYAVDRTAAWATGGMMAITEECMHTVGPWDESFFLYEEEVDFSLRAADAGFRLAYVSSAVATRLTGSDRVTPWAQALMRVNRVSLLRRRGAPVRAALVRAGYLVGAGIRSAAGRKADRAAAWALWRNASPARVLERYRPDAGAVLR
ncbi:MAG: glycosyltransferase family 2 protein [Actinomycetota bacterium]|nr:glycosyltransferase family 2 protein [Actinomycetota bacterium]